MTLYQVIYQVTELWRIDDAGGVEWESQFKTTCNYAPLQNPIANGILPSSFSPRARLRPCSPSSSYSSSSESKFQISSNQLL